MKTLSMILILLLGVMAMPVHTRDITWCLAKDNAWNSREHRARMDLLGIPCATLYYKLTSAENQANPLAWVRDHYLNHGTPTTLTLIIDDGRPTVGTSEGTDVSAGVPGLLSRVVAGEFDESLDALVRAIARDGRPIMIRPFHELDGGWYPWGIYAQGNSPELAVAAVRHVVERFRAGGARNVSFEINFNRRDGRGEVLSDAEYLIPVLNELVDAYAVSTYNRCGTAPQYVDERSFADDFRPIYDRLSSLTTLPINVAEVSTSGACAPKLPWFQAMMTALKEEFPRVKQVTFFFGVVPVGKASNSVPIYWGFDQSVADAQEFRELLARHSSVIKRPRQTLAPLRVIVPAARPMRPSTEAPAEMRRVDGSRGVESRATQIEDGVRLPWSVWGQFTHYLTETDNPALSPLSGEPFGSIGSVLRLSGRQSALWSLDDGVSVGPSLTLGAVWSPNDDQWWNNYASIGASAGLHLDAPRGLADWGTFSVELFGEQRFYITDTPDRYDGGQEFVGGVRATMSFGGDWSR